MVGDASEANGGDLVLSWASFYDDNFLGSAGAPDDSHDVTITVPNSNQYILQIDSWNGGSGAYDLTIVPEPSGSLLILLSLISGFICKRA